MFGLITPEYIFANHFKRRPNLLEKMETLHPVLDYVSGITPAQFCQSYYIFASTCILTITFLPTWLSSALMDYGPRQQKMPPTNSTKPKEKSKDDVKKDDTENQLTWLIHALEVPHSWFLHSTLR